MTQSRVNPGFTVNLEEEMSEEHRKALGTDRSDISDEDYMALYAQALEYWGPDALPDRAAYLYAKEQGCLINGHFYPRHVAIRNEHGAVHVGYPGRDPKFPQVVPPQGWPEGRHRRG